MSVEDREEKGEEYWRSKRRDRKRSKHSGTAEGAEAPEGPDNSADGSDSRPSKNNRQDQTERLSGGYSDLIPRDLPGDTALRPISVEPERRLREEAVHEVSDGPQARPWYSVLNEWREWYNDYLGSHIEFENEAGETVRSPLENSYMPEYGKRYYAKLKDLERAVDREFEDLTTVMLTLSASTLNANGQPRCPADHMRDIMDGYNAARKQLYEALRGRKWQFARVWEPTSETGLGPAGYGHLHIAVFVEDGEGDLAAEDFQPVMESHVANCGPAGSDAHRVEGDAVSVRSDVNNLGSYISEYIGIFGDEVLNRPVWEQMFYAVTWATNTRRVDFSNGAQEMMKREQFRRETGLRPEDRGGESFDRWKETGDPDKAEEVGAVEWSVRSICTADQRGPEYADPTSGGVETVAIEGRPGTDPPPEL